MSRPIISVIICTRNRAAELELTIRSILANVVPPELSVELIVVDNGSTDRTATVLQTIESVRIGLRYVSAPIPGKGHGYNKGLACAQGDILVWTDDDVRVPATWIVDMTQPILEDRADAVAGGITFPPQIARVLEREPFASRRGWFASHDYLDPTHPQAMIGANMAFHRRVLQKVPGFDVELGPGARGFCDESLFSLQLKAAGFRLVSNFDSVVEHHFDLTRATRAGLLATARGMGRSNAYVFYHWEHNRYPFALPRFAFAFVRLQLARHLDHLGSTDVNEVSAAVLRLEETVAFCREFIVQSRRPRKYDRHGLRPRDS